MPPKSSCNRSRPASRRALKNLGASLFTRILPGDTNALKAALESALDEYAPHLTLLCGQAPGRSKITLERVATNIRDFRIPDGAGNVECGSLIEASGPPAFFSNLGDIQCLADVLQNHGIPTAPSNHAGNHLCNQALYHALRYYGERDNAVQQHSRVGFMHVPALPQQNFTRWSDLPTMPQRAY